MLMAQTADAQCQTQQLLPPDFTGGDRFGGAVDISGDCAIVGALFNGDYGSAHVFRRDASGSWGDPFELTVADPEQLGNFGIDVAMHGDVVIVGANTSDDLGFNVGAAYIFRRGADKAWLQEQKLLPSAPNSEDGFGRRVAIDLPRIVIAAPRDHFDDGGGGGSVYVYLEERPGQWVEEARLTGSDTADSDMFGSGVAIDGDTLIVGAWAHNGREFNEGAAYVFRRNAEGVWWEEAKIVANDPMPEDAFGISVDVAGDLAIIGAPGVDDEGAAYVFVRQPDGTWLQMDKLEAPAILGPNGSFGQVVAIDGDRFLVGQAIGTGPGYAFLYEQDGSRWELVSTLAADRGQDGDRFGSSVALEGDFAIVGAWGWGGELGAAYVMGGLLGIDCNENGEPDACDILDGISLDCNANGIPDECEDADPCPADLDGDCAIAVSDLIALLGAWGTDPGGPPDFDGDGNVGTGDLIELLGNWGPCPR